MRRLGLGAVSAEAEQRKASDTNRRGVREEGESLGRSEGEGPQYRAAEVLGGGLSAAQEPVRTGERAGLDQLRHGRLRCGVVDGSSAPVDEHESDQQREIDVVARHQQSQCHQNQSAPHVGRGHDPAPLIAVGERAGRQREHEPRERVSCRDRRHRKWMGVHEQGKEGNGSVAEAVSQARHGESRPEVAESSP